MGIERFFVVANRDKDKDQALSIRIRDFLEARGRQCSIAYTEEERQELRSTLRSGQDCLLVLGGDGTVLEGAHLTAGTGTPILGINLGNLGYLAEVEDRNWEQALLRVISGNYEIESRMMLSGFVTDEIDHVYPGANGQALNDIVITRSRGMQILSFNVYIDGLFLNRFSADGVILSTATGSTAYSMSAGGPIVEPKARLILLTPISPHTLNNRSIVLSADDRITIEMIPPRGGGPLYAECDFDGGASIPLNKGDRINVTGSDVTTRLIRLSRRSFLETLHRKMRDYTEQ
ncbi:MAG: NAD(+)/NADH kinase [Eubacteriales bacterium]|nr:NAD(+)/NADH kinase [Eubacteriales bacterium]